MREILFRGFHEKERGEDSILLNGRVLVGQWEKGYLIRYQRNASGANTVETGIIPDYASALYMLNVIPETIGQFTGLLDKKSKQGFEHDVVKRGKSTGVIKFGDGRFYIDWGENPEFWSDTLCIHLKDSEVIGTIFDVKEEENGK